MNTSPIKIGNISLAHPAIQAALSGYSDWSQRKIARRLGAAATISEVMLDEFILSVTKGKKAKRYLRVDDEDHPVGAQLMGSLPEDFAVAAQKVVHWGFDWVDINFGCPVKKVLGRHRGGYLLSSPQIALKIIASVRNTLPPEIPVTVKMRRGMDDTPKSREHFFTIFDGARKLGISVFTIHPRTVLQRYEGTSDWNFLRELRLYAPEITLFGSGDLFTADDCLRMIKTTGVHGVTVARGGIGNPWIFQQLNAIFTGKPRPDAPNITEQKEVIQEHFSLASELYGSRHAVSIMKKFCMKYCTLHPEMATVRSAFISARNEHEWNAIFDQYYK
ncbi:MAG: tRNA-dihydrouridine synthase [Planctomycetia bacterium]|nr:tRNA-dihydrouridine synthase [Planctomycetia bacterium]